jgi:hypothetical protein
VGDGLDFVRILDPIKLSDYESFFDVKYNSITDSKFDFGFLRRNLHHFVAMAPGALERIKVLMRLKPPPPCRVPESKPPQAWLRLPCPQTPGLKTTRQGGQTIIVKENFFVDRYTRFSKGTGWVGCASRVPDQPVEFFCKCALAILGWVALSILGRLYDCYSRTHATLTILGACHAYPIRRISRSPH